MAFFGLEAYGSDDENRPSLSDSSDSASDSEDAAAAIVAAAPVALGPEPPPEKSKPVTRPLPSALDLFDRVDKPPDFLTRPMDKLGYTPYADDEASGGGRVRRGGAARARGEAQGVRDGLVRAQEVQGGRDRREGTEDGRGAVGGRGEGAQERRARGGDALAMAVLGAAPKPTPGERQRRPASGAMDVGEFLAKGPGALAPRKRGGNDRMDAERRKRQAGQNGRDSVEWKSEAEMVLRQQYD